MTAMDPLVYVFMFFTLIGVVAIVYALAHRQPLGGRLAMSVQLDTLARDLRRQLSELYGPRLKAVVVFGSFARGQARPGSDVDVAMVLDQLERPWVEIQRTSEIVSALSLAHGVSLSLIPLREDTYRRRLTPLAQNIAREGRLVA